MYYNTFGGEELLPVKPTNKGLGESRNTLYRRDEKREEIMRTGEESRGRSIRKHVILWKV